MNKLFRLIALFALLIFAASAQATTVTIDSQQIPNLQYTGSTFTMKIWVEAGQNGFTDSNGIFHIAGAVDSRNVYKTVTCTLSGTTGTCPSFTLDSTTDSLDYPSAKCHAWLYDSRNVKRDPWFVSFPVPPVTPTTWAQLRVYKNGQPKPNIPGYLNRDEVNSLINIALGSLNKASNIIEGRVRLDTAPASPSDPIVPGINSALFAGLPLSSNVQISPSTGSRLIVANNMSGADVGAKINAADLALGSDKGEIVYYGGGTIATQIVLNPYHTLHLGAGTYAPTTPDVPILMDSFTTLYGDGNSTIIQETSTPATGSAIQLGIIFQRFTYTSNGATAQHISIRDLQLQGRNSGYGSAVPAIHLGNTHHARVSNIYVNSTHSIGINVGAPALGSGSDPLSLGRYAEDVIVENCSFYKVASQNVAIVNGQNIIVQSCTFLKPSLAASGTNSIAIDVEVNIPADRVYGIQLLNNVIDSRGAEISPHGNAINYQVATSGNGNSRISGNIIYGGFYASNGILTSGFVTGLEISNNFISEVGQCGFNLQGDGLNVFGNTLIDTGTGGSHSVQLVGVTNSKFHDNVLNSPTYLDDIIIEVTACSTNTFFNNTLKSIPILQVGSNSRAWNNYDRSTGYVNTDVSQPLALNTHRYNGLTSGVVTVKPQDTAGTWTFKWPNSAGTSGQFMQTDGNGVASWATVKQMMAAVTNTGTNVAGSTTGYLFSSGQLIAGSVEGVRQVVITRPCTVRNFYIITSTAQPADGAAVYTIRKNGVDTAVTLTVAASAAAGTFSDLTHSVSFTTGDLISVKLVNASASTSSTIVSLSLEIDTP